ncbi:MAG: hypothetical protein WD070_08205 [Pirellulaceae bacterium]
MVFEHIEKLKQAYTDKFVIVDGSLPELRRFGGMTGTVRTVNMSGRALVEFDAYANIGWYDIDIDYLKVIDAPLPKPEPKPAAKQPAAKAAPAAKKAAPAAKPATGAGMSVADMLAAARGEKGGGGKAPAAKASNVADVLAAARSEKKGGGAAPAKADPKSMSVADMLAAARGEKAGQTPGATPAAPKASAPAAATKKDPKSMSVEEMLAAARGEKGGGSTTADAPATSPDETKADVRGRLEAARKPKPGAVEAEPPAEALAAAEPEAAGAGGRRNDITSIDEQLAYCRQVDAG